MRFEWGSIKFDYGKSVEAWFRFIRIKLYSLSFIIKPFIPSADYSTISKENVSRHSNELFQETSFLAPLLYFNYMLCKDTIKAGENILKWTQKEKGKTSIRIPFKGSS